MLGHASLDTTAIYTQVSIRQLMMIHAATHPAAKLEKPPDRVDESAVEDEQEPKEPTEDDIYRALDAEVEDDPEDGTSEP